MSDFLLQNSGYVIQIICLLIITGFNTLYFLRFNRRRNFPSPSQRRAILRLIGGILLFLGLLIFVAMLIIGFQKGGTASGRWASGFILATVVECTLLTVVILYLARRHVQRILDQ